MFPPILREKVQARWCALLEASAHYEVPFSCGSLDALQNRHGTNHVSLTDSAKQPCVKVAGLTLNTTGSTTTALHAREQAALGGVVQAPQQTCRKRIAWAERTRGPCGTAGAAFLLGPGGSTLSTEARRRRMLLEGKWLRTMMPCSGARPGAWHTWGHAATIATTRARRMGFASLWERSCTSVYSWVGQLARAQSGSPAAESYTSKLPLWWRTCQPRGAPRGWLHARTCWMGGTDDFVSAIKGPDWPSRIQGRRDRRAEANACIRAATSRWSPRAVHRRHPKRLGCDAPPSFQPSSPRALGGGSVSWGSPQSEGSACVCVCVCVAWGLRFRIVVSGGGVPHPALGRVCRCGKKTRPTARPTERPPTTKRRPNERPATSDRRVAAIWTTVGATGAGLCDAASLDSPPAGA